VHCGSYLLNHKKYKCKWSIRLNICLLYIAVQYVNQCILFLILYHYTLFTDPGSPSLYLFSLCKVSLNMLPLNLKKAACLIQGVWYKMLYHHTVVIKEWCDVARDLLCRTILSWRHIIGTQGKHVSYIPIICIVWWYKTLYQVEPFVWTSITTSRESDELWCGLFTQQARPGTMSCTNTLCRKTGLAECW
jgi:hypothetical protein